MHFVGKILVVLQLILSVLFMAFAGAVYSAHLNWRTEAQKQQKKVTEVSGKLKDAETAMESYKTAMEKKVKDAEDKERVADATNKTLETEVSRLKKENAELAVARKTSAEQTQIGGEEAVARNEEAENLRKLNHDQALKLDAEFAVRTKLEDDNHSLKLDLEASRQKNREVLALYAVARRALEAAGITADVRELANRSAPPPPVEGKVEEVKPAKRQGASELVEISLGSDQGLKKGHKMAVWRTGLKGGQRAKYLGEIMIINTTPDKSVGEVIENTRNGVIQKGDNVTTKL